MAYSRTQKLLLLIASPAGIAAGASIELIKRARIAAAASVNAQRAFALKMLKSVNRNCLTPTLQNIHLDFDSTAVNQIRQGVPVKNATQRMTREEFVTWLAANPPRKTAAMPRPASITYFSPTETRTQRRNGDSHGRSA